MLTLAKVLTPEDLARVRAELKTLPFQDGKATAGSTARKIKQNQQTVGADERVRALSYFIRDQLKAHPIFKAYARPAHWSKIMFSRYGKTDAYGVHTDNAMMAGDTYPRIRSDMSFTLFLSDPETYEGGALQIEGLDGEREYKPKAGDAVLYGTGKLHQVTPVTKGERVAAVGWLQSLIRRDDHREILFDLERVRAVAPEGDTRLLIDKTIGNLMREWAET